MANTSVTFRKTIFIAGMPYVSGSTYSIDEELISQFSRDTITPATEPDPKNDSRTVDEKIADAIEDFDVGITSVSSTDITDAGTAGIAVLQAGTPAQGRTALGAASYLNAVIEVPLLILIGQSNIDGRGILADAEWLQGGTFTNVKIFNKSITRNPADATVNRVDNGAWASFAYGTQMVVTPSGTNGFGPELPIALEWAAAFPSTPLYIVKCAIGGTPLASTGGGADTNWSTDTGQVWDLFLNYVLKPAIRKLRIDGKRPRCIGIVFGQGESDADTSAYAAAYATNLSAHIDRLKTLTGFSDPRCIVMGLSKYYAGTADGAAVIAAQRSVVAAKANSVFVATDGSDGLFEIPRYPNGIVAGNLHYNPNGITQLGQKFFEQLDLRGASYSRIHTEELFPEYNGAQIDSARFPFTGLTGPLSSGKYYTSAGIILSYRWIYSDGYTARVKYDTMPAPTHRVAAADNHADIDVTAVLTSASGSTGKPGVIVRGAISGSNFTGYMVQLRDGGPTICVFKATTSGNWVKIGSDLTTGISDSNKVFMRVRVVGTSINVWSSPNGTTWTALSTIADSDIASGNLYISEYNGTQRPDAPYSTASTIIGLYCDKLS